MQRRSAIRQLVIISGGVLLLPGCNNIPGNASIQFKTIKVDAVQEKLLAGFASAIIPATDTPGAGELGVHLFVLKMLDDLYESEKQDLFFKGLDLVEVFAKKSFENSFANCTLSQQEKILEGFDQKNVYPVEMVEFYKIMKQRTIDGYLNCKYVMSNLVKYELIPSVKYDGYHRVQTS